MQMTITGRHLDITATIRDYAQDKCDKFPRFYDQIQKVEVVASKIDPHQFSVELIAHVANTDHLVSQAGGPDLYACIDQASDKMERQLSRHKEKQRNRLHQD